MLAMYLFFRHLSQKYCSNWDARSRSTEYIVSEIQGESNQLQSLDAHPTLGDILSKILKVQFTLIVDFVYLGPKK